MALHSPFTIPVGGLAFVLFWCLICWILSLVSGWSRLARRFPAPAQRPVGRAFWFESGTLGGVSFRNAMNFVIAPEGLYASVFPLFRIGHPPLLIPWSAFKPFKQEKNLWMTAYETEIVLPPFDNVVLSVWNRDLKEAMHTQAYAVSRNATATKP